MNPGLTRWAIVLTPLRGVGNSPCRPGLASVAPSRLALHAQLRGNLLCEFAGFHHFKNFSSVLDVDEWIRIENDEVGEFSFLQRARLVLKTHDRGSILRCRNDDVHRT